MFTLRLSAGQKPDFPPRDDLPRARIVRVAPLLEASGRCRQFIGEHDPGGGNWSGGQVHAAAIGLVEARVSYSGRI